MSQVTTPYDKITRVYSTCVCVCVQYVLLHVYLFRSYLETSDTFGPKVLARKVVVSCLEVCLSCVSCSESY